MTIPPISPWQSLAPSSRATRDVPPWLPSWRRPQEYPGPGADARELAWEFLRRSREYQAAWERWREYPVAAVSSELARPFGLAAMHDPADPNAPEFMARTQAVKRAAVQVLLTIDFARPITPQLKQITQWARAGADAWRIAHPSISLRRQAKSRLILALRVSDARAIGVTHSEIRSALFPSLYEECGRARVRRLEMTAQAYIDGRYRLLAGIDEPFAPQSALAIAA